MFKNIIIIFSILFFMSSQALGVVCNYECEVSAKVSMKMENHDCCEETTEADDQCKDHDSSFDIDYNKTEYRVLSQFKLSVLELLDFYTNKDDAPIISMGEESSVLVSKSPIFLSIQRFII